ncbi:MAG: M14-type cytosolic carboxypeptidase [Arenicellales bacterium WSBS_2016_MAG_OTU3]
MNINSNFDGGNIECLVCDRANNIQLKIKQDSNTGFLQWFYFRLSEAKNQSCTIKIVNAGECSYVKGWQGYRAVASYDKREWFRVDTEYKDGVLHIKHQPQHDSVYYAYFAPYPLDRHADLIARMQTHLLVRHQIPGQSLDGRDMDLLVVGEPADNKKPFWVIGRQHPGETMAEWWMEGFLNRLTDMNDAVVKTLLEKTVFYVVPNMNPDGSFRGHLRTNAAGANLNREWLDASAERSPEVLCVREKMHETGVAFCLDVHGDEALPYNFIAGAEGIPDWNEQRLALQNDYKNALQRANPDFQTKIGYPIAAPGKGNLTMCTNYTAQTFSCLSMTLEMPFKDNANAPDDVAGWSPERCQKLGASSLDAMYAVIDQVC